jgi:hypothetical protein
MMSANFYEWRVGLRRFALAAALGVTAVLAACGGGGGSGGTNQFGGVTDTTSVKASDLSIALSAPTLANNGQDKITATVTAVDANRNALANIPVTVSVDADAVASVSAAKTSDKGEVIATVGTGSSRSNRVVTVTAVSGTLSRTATFQVVGAKLTARLTPAVIAPSAAGLVEFILVDGNSNPMPGQSIVIQGVGGVESSGMTGLNGDFKYSYSAPSTAGEITIRGTAGGATTTQTVLVQADSSSVPNAVGVVNSATVSANPSVVQVNSEGTENRTELRALFIGANNAPIKNIRARFDLAGDVNSIGGAITSGTNVVYSTANGIATTAYVPGGRSSPTDGVTVRVCWDYVDFALGTCPNSAVNTLTVIAEPLSVSIGTDDKIESDSTGLAYVKRYLVQVNDSSGLAKANVTISPSVDLTTYRKGFRVWNPTGTLQWLQPAGNGSVCENEDINRNGVAETYGSAKEDANGNNQLDPRKADVLLSFENGNRTDTKGQLVLRLTYHKSVGGWLDYTILVAASGVLGTEGRAALSGVLPVAADDITDPLHAPAFVSSPYGLNSSGVTIVTNSEGKSRSLCTNPN